MGNALRALHLIIDKLGDIPQVGFPWPLSSLAFIQAWPFPLSPPLPLTPPHVPALAPLGSKDAAPLVQGHCLPFLPKATGLHPFSFEAVTFRWYQARSLRCGTYATPTTHQGPKLRLAPVQAIEFVHGQQDDELWEHLISWALSSPDTTGGAIAQIIAALCCLL